jgi:hypothetical protein
MQNDAFFHLKSKCTWASSPHMRRKKQLTVKTPSGEPVRQSTLITRKQNLAGEEDSAKKTQIKMVKKILHTQDPKDGFFITLQSMNTTNHHRSPSLPPSFD